MNVASISARFTAGANRYSTLGALGLLSVIAWMAIVTASARPFWHDEIYTLQIASLPSVADIWAAERAGADLMPPLNTVVTHGIHRLMPLAPIAARLPSLACYLCFLIVVFEAVRRRAGAAPALASLVLGYFSTAFAFADTARGYAAMLLFATVALVAWSEAARGRSRPASLAVLATSLAAGAWAHYFAVMVLVPILSGEAWRIASTRRIDWGVWAALAASVCLMLPLAGLVGVAAGHSATYWRVATWSDAGATYRELAGFLFAKRFLALCAAVVAICAAGIRRRGPDPARRLPMHEIIAGCGVLVIPLLAVAVGVLATHAFVPRYALVGVLGFTMVLPLAVWALGPSDGRADIVLCAGLLMLFAHATYAFATTPPPQMTFFQAHPALERALHGPTPVAATGVTYLEAWYYAPESLRANLVYLTNRDAALALVGSDTLDRNYQTLARWAPITVIDYRAFLGGHSSFRVYASGEFAWLPDQLRRDGAAVTPIATDISGAAYDVEMPVSASIVSAASGHLVLNKH